MEVQKNDGFTKTRARCDSQLGKAGLIKFGTRLVRVWPKVGRSLVSPDKYST